MKILHLALIVIITLLAIAAGMAKLLGSPQEVQFLKGFGFNSLLIMIYGLVQVTGGVLLVIPKTLKLGATITVFAFSLSCILIAVSGNYAFFLISILPIAITAFIFWQSSKFAHDKSLKQDK
ncbi:hypothetical protein FE810_15190 [Thalassotalea litorea]|uniref:DoxX family protein n=1 Tax=Thalassotalea litorea TaxID=2020715 RepID=A0A5R9IFM6_9GAMM|nr:hypothetical protein [Thalassotalea litorea]TLU61354.1 hypothetical protein FE810_15190 [Thalassotalea litorea]